jgi:outer membrane protein OmpA-like peptidoglycan-associated protein
MKGRKRPKGRKRLWVGAAAAGVVGGLALAGCGSGQPWGSQQPPCCTASARIPAAGMLVSMNPADQSLHRAWSGEAAQVASAAGQSRARVIIDRFGSGPGSSQVTFNAPLASTNAQNKLISQVQVTQAEKRMVAGFSEALSTTSPGPVDLLSGIQQMEDHLREAHAVTADLLIFGDAVQTAGAVNLADPVQLADPKMTVAAVKQEGLLQPGACRGIAAYMINAWPAGWSSLQVEQLQEFYREFFEACGGRLVLFDSALIAFPASGEVPEASWAAGGQLTVPLPASTLFQPDRAVFLPGAGKTLGELCREMTVQYPASTASIAGYTAAVGAGDGMTLSQSRAQAVAAYLDGACGVPASRLLSVKGYGDHDQVSGGLAANRRVVVTLQVH